MYHFSFQINFHFMHILKCVFHLLFFGVLYSTISRLFPFFLLFASQSATLQDFGSGGGEYFMGSAS